MTAALIVIEVAAQQVSEDALSVLVSACTRAARGASCVLTKDASDAQSTAVAIVSLDAADKMRVEVGMRQGEHDSWRTKEFNFLPTDEQLERWRAVGFAIGTLAESDSLTTQEAPQPELEPRPEKPPAKVRPVPLPLPQLGAPLRTQMFVAAGALAGRGLDTGPMRVGGALSLLVAPPRLPLFFNFGASAASLLGDVSSPAGSASPATATARWYNLYAGVGVPLFAPLHSSGLELRTAALTDYFETSAVAGGRSESQSRWTIGVQASLAGRLQVMPGVFVTAAVEGAALSGVTGVWVAGQLLGTSEGFRYLGSVGLRVRLR